MSRQPPTVLFVGADLMARSRLQDAVARHDLELVTTSTESLAEALRSTSPSLVVIDLDSGGREALQALSDAATEGAAPDRVLGYYSHVDDELGAAARAAGCEAYPRGRFWRELPALLAPRG